MSKINTNWTVWSSGCYNPDLTLLARSMRISNPIINTLFYNYLSNITIFTRCKEEILMQQTHNFWNSSQLVRYIKLLCFSHLTNLKYCSCPWCCPSRPMMKEIFQMQLTLNATSYKRELIQNEWCNTLFYDWRFL